MSFIDTTYFQSNEINIPDYNEADLSQAIDQYEKEILIDALGYELYSLLQSDLDSGVPQSQRFKDIVDGVEFNLTYCGKERLTKWNGIKNDEKLSFVSFFIYYKYVGRTTEHLSSIGNAMYQSENSERVSPTRKLTNAFDRMLDLYGRVPVNYIRLNGNLWDIPTTIFNPLPTLYNFLASNTDVYPEWSFKPKGTINIFGI